jgi:hypothetical protein
MTWVKLARFVIFLMGLAIIIFGWIRDADLVTFVGTFIMIIPLVFGSIIKMKRS